MSDGTNENATAGAEELDADPRAAEDVITSREPGGTEDSVELLRKELEESRQDAAAHQ